MLQYTEAQLSTIYATFVEAVAAVISSEDSSEAELSSSTATSTTTLTTASGCARDDDGDLRVQFYVSAENITREIDGLLASRRRLQSTPCSTTDGTSVSSFAMHTPIMDAKLPCSHTGCLLPHAQCVYWPPLGFTVHQ